MTKIGEGSHLPKEPQYHKELEHNAAKFQNALESYSTASTPEDKAHLKGVMDETLSLMNAAIKEIRQKGIYKQGEKVTTDYKNYLESPTSQNFQVLEEDLSTLKEYNNI